MELRGKLNTVSRPKTVRGKGRVGLCGGNERTVGRVSGAYWQAVWNDEMLNRCQWLGGWVVHGADWEVG